MNTNQQLRIFVYGTLKRGYWNHDRFCSQAVSIEPATTWGRLFHLPAGFPALVIPPENILATGTADPIADTRLQNETKIPKPAFKQPQSGDWDLIHGELMTFSDPGINLPPIDRLEGFNPHGRSMYDRVLSVVKSKSSLHTCWIYFGVEGILRSSQRLPDGCWDAPKLR